MSNSQADDLPIDPDKIPDRWAIHHDYEPITDPEAVILDYGRDENEHGEPTASIILQTANTPRGPEDGYAVEVQDKNADGAAMSYLNPLAVWEPHTDHALAVDQLYRMADEYPLPATRSDT